MVRETGVAAHVLRYWEQQIPALRPVRRAGGRRYYRSADVDYVRALHHLVSEEGYTLEGAARAMQRSPVPAAATTPVPEPVAAVSLMDGDGTVRDPAARERLRWMRARLVKLDALLSAAS